MTQRNRHRFAAFMALIPGLLSIKEGGSVLLGYSTPAYHVLPWLVMYNVVLGVVSVIAGIGVWRQRVWGIKSAATILPLHGLVLIILITLFAFKEAVALTSIMAMVFRTAVWLVIVVLLTRKSEAPAEKT